MNDGPAPNRWPSDHATGGKPAPRQPTRLELIHRIAELQGRYRTRQVGDKVRLVDMENGGAIQPPEYPDEDLAKAGAKMLAANDIYDLLRPEGGGK